MSKRGIRSKKYVTLQDRDFEMFRWIAEQKFATRSQLAKQFFPNQAEG